MFLKIDAWLIRQANWCVRQVEIYTNGTRKSLYALWLFLLKATSAVTAVCVLLLLISELNMLHGVFLLSSIAQIMNYSIYKLWLDILRDDSDALPIAIIMRKIPRMILLTELSFMVPFFVLYIIVLGEWYMLSTTDYVITLAIFGMMIYLICSLVMEYILCTHSIPPAERVRRVYMRTQAG